MKRFRIHVETGFPGAEHIDEVTFEEADWQAMTEEEREQALIQAGQDAINNFVEAWHEEITEEIGKE